MKKGVTIKDVAKRAGVSHPVVSTVLGKGGSTTRVSEATAGRVLAAARELKYKPNILARGFQQRKSFIVGILASEAINWLLADLIWGVQEQLSQDEYSPMVLIHRNREEERAYLQRCLDRKVDGLIVNLAVNEQGQTNADLIKGSVDPSVPVVTIFGRDMSPSISVDFRADGRAATEHLLSLGHRRIALLTHDRYRASETAPPLHWDAWEHSLGYQDAMRAAGAEPIVLTHPLPNALQVDRAWTDAGFAMGPRLFDAEAKITAVVCLLDQQAYGVIRAARHRGVAVPDQLAVVGHRDLDLSEIVEPALTTLRTSAQQIGRSAAQAVLEMMANRTVIDKSFGSELVRRESTGRNALRDSNV